jgi:hypothetical protein
MTEHLETFEAKLDNWRARIQDVGGEVVHKGLVHPAINDLAMEWGANAAQEAVANLTLAFRHLEDARMRLGKAIQQVHGGVSIYDKKGDS